MSQTTSLVKPRQKYTADYEFFKNIDNEEKAYFLGMLTADGHIGKDGVYLGLVDLDVIEQFNKSLKSNYPIKEYKGPKSKQILYQVRIYNMSMKKSLEKYGIIPNKTFNIFVPDLPKYLYEHYIRGVFDGDGYVTKNKAGHFYFGISSSNKKFLEQLRNIIPIPGLVIYDCTGTSTYELRTTSKINAINIHNYMYKEATIYMKRKFNKWQEYLEARSI